MANKHFDEFREVESKILRFTMVKDNLRVIAEHVDLADQFSNSIELNAEVIEETLDELKDLLETIEGREPECMTEEEDK